MLKEIYVPQPFEDMIEDMTVEDVTVSECLPNNVESVAMTIELKLRSRFGSAVYDINEVIIKEKINCETFGLMKDEDIAQIFRDFSFEIRKALEVLAKDTFTSREKNNKKSKINLTWIKKIVCNQLKSGVKKGRKIVKKGGRIIKVVNAKRYTLFVHHKSTIVGTPDVGGMCLSATRCNTDIGDLSDMKM